MPHKLRPWDEGQPSPYQLRDFTHFPDWRNLIVWDAFFNNLAAGLMLISAIAWGAGAQVFTTVLPLALTVALCLLLIDLGLLVLDLADPWRFPHSLRVMRFTSPLSVGVWGLSSYAIFLGLAVLLSWVAIFSDGEGILFYFMFVMARLFIVMASIGAVVVICYKGVVFSCSSQPGLKDARWLTPFMVSDSLLMGLGLYTLILVFFFSSQAAISLLIPFVVLIIARCIAFSLLWQNVRQRALLVHGGLNRALFWLVYGFGGILAMVLAFCGSLGLVLASVIALLCGIAERYWIISLPRPARHLPA